MSLLTCRPAAYEVERPLYDMALIIVHGQLMHHDTGKLVPKVRFVG